MQDVLIMCEYDEDGLFLGVDPVELWRAPDSSRACTELFASADSAPQVFVGTHNGQPWVACQTKDVDEVLTKLKNWGQPYESLMEVD